MVKINLEDDEVKFLKDIVKKGQKSARELTRARRGSRNIRCWQEPHLENQDVIP